MSEDNLDPHGHNGFHDHHHEMDGLRGSDRTNRSDSKYEEERIENGRAPVAKPPRRRRVRNHCARFWWLHLLIFCICFLIIALCLVYVAMPKIAQHGVNESSLEFYEMDFINPTSNSVELTQRAILHSPSIYTPLLDAFLAESWLVTNGVFASVPMIAIPMPAIHAIHPQSNVSIENQNCTIQNMEALDNYTIATITQEYVTTALTGKTQLHEGHLPVVTVNYNSSSTYKGLNGLKGFNVTGLTVNISDPTTATRMNGIAFIPNPSVMTIEMGNVTLNLTTAQEGQVGTAIIQDMTLRPGNNSLPMQGIVNQQKMLASLDSSGVATLQVTGESAIYNGEHLTYYEKALASNVLTLPLNVTQVIRDSI